jgi:NADH-quinone oxidoreductase subunit H
VEALLDNFWALLVIKLVLVLGIFLVFPLVVGFMEHKVLAHMQARLGPMEAGRYHGVLQLVADGIKFVQKEMVFPKAVDRWVFSLAPAVAVVPTILIFAFIPWGENLVPIRSDISLFAVLALSGVTTIAVLMAAWASANKYSLIGGVRAAAQLIAYELPLVLIAAAVAMQAGSADLAEIAAGGVTVGGVQLPYIFAPWLTVGFVVFYIAAVAELERPPFDMPIADAEIVAGHLTEYTGLRFAFFLLTEYAGIVWQSAVMATLFLGGYQGPVAGGPWWLVIKIFALSFVFVWLRATYPRLREDQLQSMAWTRLVPISLALILVAGFVKVV